MPEACIEVQPWVYSSGDEGMGRGEGVHSLSGDKIWGTSTPLFMMVVGLSGF